MSRGIVHPPELTGPDIQLVALHSLWQHTVGQSENTIKARQFVLRRLRYEVGVPLVEITPAQLAAWQTGLAGMKRWTVATYVNHAKSFYRWARRYGHRADDPSIDVLQRPRTPRGVPMPIPDDQLKLALACAQPQMRAMLALMAFAGLRCAEVATLRREDIRDYDDPRVMTITGKGGHQRIMPLPDVLLDALQAAGLPRSGLVFVQPTDARPYTPNRVSAAVGEHLRGIGISYSAHKLRHAFGTSVYRLSGDLLLTQKLMGHANANTTQGYALYADGAATRVADQMDARGRQLLGTRADDDPPPAAALARPTPDPDPLRPSGEAPSGPPDGYGHGLRLIQGGAA